MLSQAFAAAEGAYAMHMPIKGAYASAFAVHRTDFFRQKTSLMR